MPPKRSKSQTGSAGAQKWESGLLTAQFAEDGKWNGSVSFVVENRVEDLSNLEVFVDTVSSGCRKLFSVVTKDDIYETVRDLGNTKNPKKGKEVPQFSEICEPCKVFLDSNEEIPLILQAKLIKYRLLDIKTRDIKRRETEKKAASDGPKSAVGKAAKGADKKGGDRAKSAGKGKGGKKTPELPSAKNDSKLKKRGEEDEEGKYIDDEPDDGPQHYVIVTGFHSPHLPALLGEIGVQVDSVIGMHSEDYTRFEPKPVDDDVTEAPTVDEKQAALAEGAEKDKRRLEKELRVFWKDLKYLLKAPSLYDIARFDYIVKDDIIPDDVKEPEKKEEYGKALFEDIACMIYDMLDAKRQWKNYLDNLNLRHIPVFGEPSPPSHFPDGASTAIAPTPSQKKTDVGTTEDGKSMVAESEVKPPPEVDMRYYNEMMNAIPQESVSVPLILHSMLQQVVATEEGLDPPSEVAKPKREDGLEENLAKHISHLAYKLALSEDEQDALAQDFDKPRMPDSGSKMPLLINHHDEMCERLNHLKPADGLDPMRAELEMMGFLPLADLCRLRQPSEKVAMERAARLQELVHFVATGGLTQAEVDRAFKQFVFECMDLTRTDDDGNVMFLQNKQRDVPWDDPYPYFKGMIPVEDDEEDMEEVMQITDIRPPTETNEPTDRSTEAVFSPLHAAEELTLGMEASDLTSKRDMATGTGRSGRSPKRQKSPKRAKAKDKKGPTPHPRAEETPIIPAVPEEPECPSTPGILRRPDSAGSRKSSSVHFEKNAEGELVPQPGDEAAAGDDTQRGLHVGEEGWSEVNDKHQRSMDQWCFAEHLEPTVFMQVLKNAQHTHPFLDTYYHKRDHSLLVVLHNPMNSQLTSHVTWHTKLHSDLGFRNYLEHMAESIDEWTREQEAKYQAGLVAHEVEGIVKEAEADSRPGSATKGKKGTARGGKDEKKGKSPARSRSASRSSSQERAAGEGENLYVRHNSLKAYKEEQERVKAEEDAKEREKELKRIKSADKKKEKEAKEKEEKAKKGKGGSRANSAKSKASKEDAAEGEEQEPKEPERFWPFSGYDMGNNLVEVHGVTSALYPADGGQIRVDKVHFEQGSTSVRTAVLKDGHTFLVHVLDPKVEGEDQPEDPTPPSTPTPRSTVDDSEEKQDTERTEKETLPEAPCKPCVGVFGSFSATLRDGMNLAFSTYGDNGEPLDGKKYSPEPYVAPRPPTPAPVDGKATPGKGKGKDKGKAATPEPAPAPTDEEETKSETKPETVKMCVQPFQQMHITCPDGLTLNYFLESSVGIEPENEDTRKIVVKQCYPFKTRGTQECEAVRRRAMQEVSRVINTDGTVVKTMVDGTIQVLFADGTVSEFVQNSPVLPSGSRGASLDRPGSGKSPERETPSPTKKASRPSRKSPRKKEQVEEEPGEAPPTGFWITTTPSGERCCTRLDNSKIKVKRALISMASDPATSQSMQTREDHVVRVEHPDGTTVVEHADGTRITTFWREISVAVHGDDSGETGETPDTELRQVKVVVVECPGFSTVKFDTNSLLQCSTEFGNGTVIHVSVDGSYDVYHSDGGYLQVESDGSASYFPRPNNELEVHNPNQQLQYNLRHMGEVVVDMVDNEGNQFHVTSTGQTGVQLSSGQMQAELKESGLRLQEQAREASSGELIEEKAEGEQSGEKQETRMTYYKQQAPRLFICHADGSGTELLRYQDVAEYMANAEDDPTTAILMDSLPDYPGVMGITVLRPHNKTVSQQWIKPYIQDTIIPPGLVSRDLTTIPAHEEKKAGPAFGTNVGTGLAVGSAVRALPTPPILKCPSKLEIRQILQYKPISEELRNGLWEGLKNYGEFVRTKLENSELLYLQDPRSPEEQAAAGRLQDMAIPPQRENTMPVEGRASRLDGEDIKHVYERATAPPIPSPPPTPQNKRTKADWERDERELAEEIANRDKLKNHDVPAYFESELGKAFLLTQAPDMESMRQIMKEDPRSDNSKAIRSNSSTPASRHSSSAPPPEDVLYLTSDRSLSSTPPTGFDGPALSSTQNSNRAEAHTGTTPSAVRPGNPTPAHAQGNGSPSSVRPNNPTPAHATKLVPDRPGAPTPKQGKESESPNSQPFRSIQEQPTEEAVSSPAQASPPMLTGTQVSPMPNNLNKTVIGAPRLDPVRVPAYLRTGRPLAAPNFRHGMVEDPVRRKVYTSSVAGATPVGAEIIARMRGFEMLPTHVNFGVLREGTTYSFPVQLKNTGVDACRYKIKQPPPSTGIKVQYKPGPIAAGMKIELDVQIYAIANGVEGGRGVGQVNHKLDIITETDHLFLPIRATVLTAYEYDNRSPESPEGGKSPGARMLTNKAPGRLRKSVEPAAVQA